MEAWGIMIVSGLKISFGNNNEQQRKLNQKNKLHRKHDKLNVGPFLGFWL